MEEVDEDNREKEALNVMVEEDVFQDEGVVAIFGVEDKDEEEPKLGLRQRLMERAAANPRNTMDDDEEEDGDDASVVVSVVVLDRGLITLARYTILTGGTIFFFTDDDADGEASTCCWLLLLFMIYCNE
jgi:hypothetical protein